MCLIKNGKVEAPLAFIDPLFVDFQLQAWRVQADHMATLVLLLEALWRCCRDTSLDFLGQGAEEQRPGHCGDGVGRKHHQAHGNTRDYNQISCETVGEEKVAQSWKVGDSNVWP